MTKLPDDSNNFKDIPINGHICSLKVDGKRHYWKVEHLIQHSKNIKPTIISIDKLIEKLGNSTWFNTSENITILKIIPHIQRALNADLRYPIIISENGKIMDGAHRIVGAKLKEVKKLKAVQFKTNPIADYVKE